MNLKDSKKIKIKSSLKDLVQDSTAHGIPRLVKSRYHLMKFIWMICFLTTTGICLYLISNSVYDYLNYDFNTQIKTVREIPSVFPTVTFCSLNYYPNKKAVDFMYDFLSRNPNVKNYSVNQQNFYIFNELFKYNDSFIQSLSLSLNETVL